MARPTAQRAATSIGSRITALLGPTNTGKTHRAVERMLDHDSGMLGFPLRLLAREVYEKVVQRVSPGDVALITGEEKLVPAQARYFICTVEAMPLDLEVDFLGVDEIQLAAHPQRGHTFTDRLLYRRGRVETWFLGSTSVEHLVAELVPTASIRRHPRLSELRGSGQASIGQLKPGSAVVAFTAARVYELAERVRRRRGGAAVVLGALSPRARNAQVALYQSGDVNYLVATDAIGMGLNLSIQHVAFADVRKFDGRESRQLELGELAQIAGRAGRHLQDGSFGTLSPEPELPYEVVQALELHRLPRARQLWWRNPELEMANLDALLESLRLPAPSVRLRRADQAEDHQALTRLAALPSVRKLAHGPAAVELLWAVAQIPDYRKVLFEQHLVLLEAIYEQLLSHSGRLGTDWLAARVNRLDDPRGDLEALLTRIAFVRTWTYVTHHRAWVEDAAHWQARTREIEDTLSDALHEALVLRFVDRSKTYAHAENLGKAELRAAAERGTASAQASGSGAVAAAAEARGAGARLGSPQAPAGSESGILADHPFAALADLRAQLRAAEPQHVVTSIEDRVADATDAELELLADGKLRIGELTIAQLIRGPDLLSPGVRALSVAASEAQAPARDPRALQRLAKYVRDLTEQHFGQLRQAAQRDLTAAGRGLAYQLEQGLGNVEVRRAAEQLALLGSEERSRLEQVGVYFGERYVYLGALFTGRALVQRQAWVSTVAALPEIPTGAVRVEPARQISARVYQQLGFSRVGSHYLRIDLLERALACLAAQPSRFQPPGEVSQWLGLRKRELPAMLSALGYISENSSPEAYWRRQGAAAEPRSNRRKRRRKRTAAASPNQTASPASAPSPPSAPSAPSAPSPSAPVPGDAPLSAGSIEGQ